MIFQFGLNNIALHSFKVSNIMKFPIGAWGLKVYDFKNFGIKSDRVILFVIYNLSLALRETIFYYVQSVRSSVKLYNKQIHKLKLIHVDQSQISDF
jgi:hypothetical protein